MPLADGEAPEAAVAQRARERRRLELVLVDDLGATADDGSAHDSADHAQRGEEEEACRRVAVRDQRRKGEGGDEPPERNRGLPNAEREPTLVGGEPVHDGAAARRVHARTCARPRARAARRATRSPARRRRRRGSRRTRRDRARGRPARRSGRRRSPTGASSRARPSTPRRGRRRSGRDARSYSSRSVGTSTGSPIARAENDVCESVPAARTAQR